MTQIQTTNQMIREFERVLGRPLVRWKRDADGYSLSLPSGASAWVSKGATSKSNPSWYGRATGTTGQTVSVRGWTLASAKSAAERLLGVIH
jgi:hypothetical protein